MFIDKTRSAIHNEIRRQEQQLFAHLLTPDLFVQAALMCGLSIVASPLNLINLVWLALSAARHPELSFAALLDLPVNALRDDERFAASDLHQRIDDANRQRQPRGKKRHAHQKTCTQRRCHSPHAGAAEKVSTAAFVTARRRMPSEFWVALFVLLGQRFTDLYADTVRWGRFRLLAVDGTGVPLPDYPALREHFGTAKNGHGSHNAQARLVLLLLPLARFPLAYTLQPFTVGESTMARQLLQGLRANDLVLLDAGFRSYGVLAQIQRQDAYFCLRLSQKLNLKVLETLGSKNDVLVQWQPRDNRGKWRREGLPKSLRLRRLTYHSKGFRPLHLLTNVLSAQQVPYEKWWGLSVSEEGEVLARGIYHFRWEIETTYRERKVEQQLEGSLRSRSVEGIAYEVAGHVLHYLLMRWVIAEAAQAAQVSPLRLSFQEALRESQAMSPAVVVASAGWVEQTLRPRLLQRIGSHVVTERPGRTYPRRRQERRAAKRASTAKFRRQEKAKAKAGGKRQAKSRPWFGDGWDLRGRKADPDPPPQG
jgi:hypothetical protein